MDSSTGAGETVDIVQVKLGGKSRDNTGNPVSVTSRPGTYTPFSLYVTREEDGRCKDKTRSRV